MLERKGNTDELQLTPKVIQSVDIRFWELLDYLLTKIFMRAWRYGRACGKTPYEHHSSFPPFRFVTSESPFLPLSVISQRGSQQDYIYCLHVELFFEDLQTIACRHKLTTTADSFVINSNARHVQISLKCFHFSTAKLLNCLGDQFIEILKKKLRMPYAIIARSLAINKDLTNN